MKPKPAIFALVGLGLSLLLTLWTVGCRESAEAMQLFGGRSRSASDQGPQRPLPRRYARVALGEDATKVLSIVYEASEGTATGYDRVYADFDSTVDPAKAEKLTAKVHRQGTRVTCPFPPFALGRSGTCCSAIAVIPQGARTRTLPASEEPCKGG